MGDDEELEEARKKKLETRKAEEQLKGSLRAALEDSAYERLMNVSHANRELYFTTARQVLGAWQRIGRRIKESELVKIIEAIKAQTETETKISFHRK